jgi:hypothetical protein
MTTLADAESAVLYEPANGRIISYARVREGRDPFPDRHDTMDIMCFAGLLDISVKTHRMDLDTMTVVEGQVPQPFSVSLPQLATWDSIKTARNTFEQIPVNTPHGYLDADTDSMERLRLAVKQYVFLPTLQNGKLAWKMADNTIALFNQIELNALYEEADRIRSIRAAYLHVKAEELAAMDPAPTLEFISNINNWIEP